MNLLLISTPRTAMRFMLERKFSHRHCKPFHASEFDTRQSLQSTRLNYVSGICTVRLGSVKTKILRCFPLSIFVDLHNTLLLQRDQRYRSVPMKAEIIRYIAYPIRVQETIDVWPPNIQGSFGVRTYVDYGHSGAFLNWEDAEHNQK